MGRNRLASILAVLIVALLALPAFAQASGEDVIRDCNEDGSIDGSYSQDEYQDAQDNLPSDVDQYSDCRDVIAQAQADGSRGTSGPKAGSSGGGGGAGQFDSGGAQSRRGGTPELNEGNPALQTDSGAYANTPEDKAAYDAARAEAARGGGTPPRGLTIPAAGEFKAANVNGLPMPILLAMISVGLLAAATSVLVARKRLPALNRVTTRFRRS